MAYSLDFSGRVALVTGASGGLCAQFAKTLSRAGAAVVLASRRMDKLKDLRAQIGVYCMSKAAVVQMTKAMALEWGKFGCGFWAQSPNSPSRKADPAGTTHGVAAKLVSDPNNPTPRSITTTGKPSRAKNWCKCCRANALASRKTWMPCWSCWPAVKATSLMVR